MASKFAAWADELDDVGQTQQPKSQFSAWTAELEGKKLDPRATTPSVSPFSGPGAPDPTAQAVIGHPAGGQAGKLVRSGLAPLAPAIAKASPALEAIVGR